MGEFQKYNSFFIILDVNTLNCVLEVTELELGEIEQLLLMWQSLLGCSRKGGKGMPTWM